MGLSEEKDVPNSYSLSGDLLGGNDSSSTGVNRFNNISNSNKWKQQQQRWWWWWWW